MENPYRHGLRFLQDKVSVEGRIGWTGTFDQFDADIRFCLKPVLVAPIDVDHRAFGKFERLVASRVQDFAGAVRDVVHAVTRVPQIVRSPARRLEKFDNGCPLPGHITTRQLPELTITGTSGQSSALSITRTCREESDFIHHFNSINIFAGQASSAHSPWNGLMGASYRPNL